MPADARHSVIVNATLEAELDRYRARMNDISEFMKTLKQNMTMSFNARRDHAGTIWEGRFYDKRSDPTAKDMSAQAAYVDCNPVEAGICRNPAEYKWCSWAAAMSGNEHARDMYRFIYEGVADEWSEIVKLHKAAIRARIGEIAEVAAAALQALAQGSRGFGESGGSAYTVTHIRKGLVRQDKLG